MYDLEWQSKKIKKDKPITELLEACSIGNGIYVIDESEKRQCLELYDEFNGQSTMFVPASGSGSRMFQNLKDFKINTDFQSDFAKTFFNNLFDFAFMDLVPDKFKKGLKSINKKKELINYLFISSGLNYENIPKGLIHFHKKHEVLRNPFQDQIIQGVLVNSRMNFHFTIQENYHKEIMASINQLDLISQKSIDINFSFQLPLTDAFVFNNNGSVMYDNSGQHLRRPSGHGALLQNLNTIKSNLIFVKNIDNVQHFDKSEISINYFKIIGGLLLKIKKDLKNFSHNCDVDKFVKWNNKYQLFSKSEIDNNFQKLINRPIRVCGMVRNEGAPGGGPFWIKSDKTVTKQIVEQSQVLNVQDQFEIFENGLYFNPVFMVLDIKDFNDENYNLVDYSNNNRYLIVNKKYKGEDIHFIERPGLWNGGMEKWNSLFVEVPIEIFSPVKSVVDLLSNSHRANE